MLRPGTLDWLAADIRRAARSLVRRRRFTAAAVLTFALGIGASTAIVSVVYGVLLRPLPYRDAARLLVIQTRVRSTGAVIPLGFSGPDLEDWRERATSLESLALSARDIFALDTGTGFETVGGAFVSREFFAVLGVEPALGRTFADGAVTEMVISDRLWRSRFQADAGVVGRAVRVNAEPYTIVGVAPAWMTFPLESRSSVGAPPEPPDVWAPLEGSPATVRREGRWGQLVGRMAAGLTFAQVSWQLDSAARAFGRDNPGWAERRAVVISPLSSELTGALRPALWLLAGAVACVLLVACANVANLLLARQTSRAAEIALSVSLGAPRHRLIAPALAEAVLLALAGGALGVLLAWWTVATLRWLEPADLPRLDAIRVDLPILVFAVGLSTLAALVASAAPAWRLMRARRDLAPGADGKASASTTKARRTRSVLVVAELAVALVLLVGATLLSRSFVRLVGADIGVATDHVVTVELNLAMGRTLPPAAQIQLAGRLVSATAALPGILGAAVANGLPPNQTRMRTVFTMADVQSDLPREHDMALLNPTSDYFSVLGIPLLRGRTFGPGDGTREPGVAILNASAARHLFGSLDVAGRTLPVSRTGVPVTIVGVVGDVKYAGLDQRAEDTVYVPFPQYPFRNMMLVARTAGDVDALARSLGAAVHRVDPAITIGRVQTLDEVVRAAVARPRFRTALFASLAGLALVLAAVGLFGVAAYAVTERTKEIGIRMALGAGRRQVVGMIVRDTLRLATAGTAIGVIAALFFTRALAAFVYGVTTRDLPSFVLAAAGLVAVSVAASYTAARRAANVDPATLLHAE